MDTKRGPDQRSRLIGLLWLDEVSKGIRGRKGRAGRFSSNRFPSEIEARVSKTRYKTTLKSYTRAWKCIWRMEKVLPDINGKEILLLSNNVPTWNRSMWEIKPVSWSLIRIFKSVNERRFSSYSHIDGEQGWMLRSSLLPPMPCRNERYKTTGSKI